MFGDIGDHIKVSENVELDIPDSRACRTCDRFSPTTDIIHKDSTTCYMLTCFYKDVCKYIYDEAVVALDKKLEEAFNGELKEEKEGQ